MIFFQFKYMINCFYEKMLFRRVRTCVAVGQESIQEQKKNNNNNKEQTLTSVVRPRKPGPVDGDFYGFYVVRHQHHLVLALNRDSECQQFTYE